MFCLPFQAGHLRKELSICLRDPKGAVWVH